MNSLYGTIEKCKTCAAKEVCAKDYNDVCTMCKFEDHMPASKECNPCTGRKSCSFIPTTLLEGVDELGGSNES